MSFSFKRKESVPKAIRRLGCDRTKNALDCLNSRGDGKTIHTVRKDIKKIRAVLRLVQPRIAKKSYRRVIKILREAATELTGTRDAHVTAAALKDLRRQFSTQLAPGAFRKIRSFLQEEIDKESRRFAEGRSARKVESLFRRVEKQMSHLDVKGDGWNVLQPGIKRAYREGQQAYGDVLDDGSDENFHEWRKRAKDIWYQARMLRPVWPEQLDAMASELKELTEYLGDDHDLVILREIVTSKCAVDGEVETLRGLIVQRQRELRGAALNLGARFFSEKPSAFCDRLAEYWQTWKKEKKRNRNMQIQLAEV